MKDFDHWNVLKKNIQNDIKIKYCKQREIWWTSIGLNIGSEEDGKNNLYERPVLILKVFSQDLIRVLPLSSRLKNDEHNVIIKYEKTVCTALLSQMKSVSKKRLTRKIGRLSKYEFEVIVNKIRTFIV